MYMVKRVVTERLPSGERRRRILEAALGVVGRHGYAGLTTARLARTAGISEPILYRHFPSKRAILRALLDEIISRMMTTFERLIEGEKDPVAALRRICEAYPQLSRQYRHEFRVINQALLEEGDRPTRAMLARHYGAYREFLQKLIEDGQRAGALRRDIPASVGAWHLIQSALGFLLAEKIRPSGAEWAKGFADATLGGLLKVA
jgi:TetR/AcrR family transcriptional regulator